MIFMIDVPARVVDFEKGRKDTASIKNKVQLIAKNDRLAVHK